MANDRPLAPDPSQVTRLLIEANAGDRGALNDLFPLVYDQLRGLARARLRSERPDHTLNTTALVHEAYLKLVDQKRAEWRNRAHFFAIASQAMRRILIDYARMKNAAKRGGDAVHVPLEEADFALSDGQVEELLALDDSIERLRAFNERGADVVVYRFFGGLTYDEIGQALGVSGVTARRSWSASRAWLRRELRQLLPGWRQSTLTLPGESL